LYHRWVLSVLQLVLSGYDLFLEQYIVPEWNQIDNNNNNNKNKKDNIEQKSQSKFNSHIETLTHEYLPPGEMNNHYFELITNIDNNRINFEKIYPFLFTLFNLFDGLVCEPQQQQQQQQQQNQDSSHINTQVNIPKIKSFLTNLNNSGKQPITPNSSLSMETIQRHGQNLTLPHFITFIFHYFSSYLQQLHHLHHPHHPHRQNTKQHYSLLIARNFLRPFQHFQLTTLINQFHFYTTTLIPLGGRLIIPSIQQQQQQQQQQPNDKDDKNTQEIFTSPEAMSLRQSLLAIVLNRLLIIGLLYHHQKLESKILFIQHNLIEGNNNNNQIDQNELLTPTLKLRRQPLAKHYLETLKNMYQRLGEPALEGEPWW